MHRNSRDRPDDRRKRFRSRSRSRSRSEERHRSHRPPRRDSDRDTSRRSRSRSRSPASKPQRDHQIEQPTANQPAADDQTEPTNTQAEPSKGDEAEDNKEQMMRERRERLKAWREAQAKKQQPLEPSIAAAKEPETRARPPSSVEVLKSYEAQLESKEVSKAQAAETAADGDGAAEAGDEDELADREEAKPRWTLEDDQEDEDDDAEGSGIKTGDSEQDTLIGAAEAEPPALPHRSELEEEEEEAATTFERVAKAPASARRPRKASRWEKMEEEQEAPQVPASRVAAPAVMAAAPAQNEPDGEDPLDEFMSSLYDSGAVAAQKELQAPTIQRLAANESKPVAGMARLARSGESALDRMKSNAPVSESEDDMEAAGIDWHGSNTITLDQILGDRSQGAPVGAGGTPTAQASNNIVSRNGWESDANDSAVNSPRMRVGGSSGFAAAQETEEAREAREERERQDFVEAIRRARQEEEKSNEQLRKLEIEAAQQRDQSNSARNEELRRIFDGEDDILDEYGGDQKRRSVLEMLEEAKRGKVLKEVDHSKIQYLPFRKNLYIVPKALARLSEDEVLAKRHRLQVKVRGKGCPAPVDSWEQCGLSDRILQCIYANKLVEPFAIQKQAIPAIMCGRDIIGVAKTGSGKTLAFLLPMFRHILDQPPLQESEGPIGLIMAPARELAFQIYNEAKKFTKTLGMRVACIYGGAGVAEQIADLKRGSQIVVCTPGRMIDILCMQAGKVVSLKRVTMVVLDEADRMFDMGFEPQIKMILQNVRPDRQTVLFSATFPKQIEKLAKSVLRLPLEIIVGERSSVNKDITQFIEVREEEDKFLRLLQLLGLWYERGSVLVFVDKQEKCDQLFQDLLRLGYPCLSLHGGKDQVDRDHTLHEFKTGVKTVMIATSVAGRGLDVPEIVCVVNYSCPNHLEDYVHRVGRTGRAGRKGTAYTFVSSKEEQYAPVMVKALQKAGQAVPDELQALAQAFKEKVERGEAHWSSSGFMGKGFTFEADEMNEAQKTAMLQRRAYEMEQGLLPEASHEDADDELEDEGEADEREKEKEKERLPREASLSAAASTGVAAAGSAQPQAQPQLPPQLAGLARDKVQQIAARLLGAVKPPEDKTPANGGGSFFADELEINDYPAQARKKVTSKDALGEISERTGVAFISRGSHVPSGKKPEAGERRLHLRIEGTSELTVRQAKMEIQRALEEETLRLSSSGMGSASSGRYSVV